MESKELFQLLEAAGFERRTGKGSHTIYTHPRYRLNVSIPSQKPLKPAYVKLATQAVEAVLENGEER